MDISINGQTAQMHLEWIAPIHPCMCWAIYLLLP